MPDQAGEEQRPPTEPVDPGDRDQGRKHVDEPDGVQGRLGLLLGAS